jgi:hypothetical protein
VLVEQQGGSATVEVVVEFSRKVPRRALTCLQLRKASPKLQGKVGMELLEKLPEVTVKGDGAELVKHVSSGSAKQIMDRLF